MKRLFYLFTFLLLGFSSVLFLLNPRAQAYSRNRMIEDSIFDNSNSMSEAAIRSFINSRPGTCLVNSGAIFPEPKDYYTYGPNNVDAARVIYIAAQTWGLNPQVILTTLQKEQTLLTDNNCIDPQGFPSLPKAMGYFCLEGGTCPPPNYAGFEKQVMKGSWQLKFNKERAEGNLNWDGDQGIHYNTYYTQGNRQDYAGAPSIYHDGYITIDGNLTYLENGATASLYRYTPHWPQTFDTIFSSWFGNPTNGSQLTNSLGSNQLSNNTTMNPGDYLVSPNGVFVTVMQYDGNLVTYDGSRAVWASQTLGHYGAHATFQTDGNLVIYAANGSVLWSPNTYGVNANKMALGDDGNLVIYTNATVDYSTNITPSGTQNLGAQVQSPTTLNAGSYIRSSDGMYTMIMQSDGNLVLYAPGGAVLWASGTWGHPGSHAAVQADGNLVLSSSGGSVLWASATFGQGASTLKLQTDGNLVLYNGSNAATWSTGTWKNYYQVNNYVGGQVGSPTTLNPSDYLRSTDYRYRLVMQSDGNLVLYSANARSVLWASGTWGHPGSHAAVQADGNLVLSSSGGSVLWASGTWGQGASTLKLQTDGNLVLYNGSNAATWSTGTFGKF